MEREGDEMSLDTPNRMAPCFKVVVLEILFDEKKY